MPLPIRTQTQNEDKVVKVSYGPKAQCDCGKCKKCKNRARQRKYYDEHRTDILTGDFFQRIDEDEDDK